MLKEGRLAAEITMQAKLTHSETLLPHIEQALRMAGVKKEDLTGIAVSIGPGSFTGLRIGLAAAKAMSYALRIPIVGVPSLEALALHYRVPGVTIFALMDAQKKNVYVEQLAWQREGSDLALVVQSPVEVQPLADVLAEAGKLAADGQTVVLVGDIVQKRFAGKDGRRAGKMQLPDGVLALRMWPGSVPSVSRRAKRTMSWTSSPSTSERARRNSCGRSIMRTMRIQSSIMKKRSPLTRRMAVARCRDDGGETLLPQDGAGRCRRCRAGRGDLLSRAVVARIVLARGVE